MLSVLFAVVFPLFYRLYFIKKQKGEQAISAQNFWYFERKMMQIALISPYFTVYVSISEMQTLYFAGTVIAGLYAAYYYYPHKKRIELEKQIFRIQ